MTRTETSRSWSLPWAGYQRDWLRYDVIAGLSAGAVVIPQAMAYATIAGMPVEIGLYTCMVPMLVYAALGGSRSMSVSTTSTIATLVASSLIAAGIAKDSSDPTSDLGTLVLMVGVILLLARVLHLGSLVENISMPVTTGVKIGVGLTVASGQLPKLLGVPPDPDADTFIPQVKDAVTSLPDANGATVLLSVGTLATLWVIGRFLPVVPGPLVVVAGGILLVTTVDLDQHGVALIPDVPQGLPVPGLPAAGHVADLLPGAMAIALMAFLETAAVARGLRRQSEPAIDSERELLAVGSASVVGAFFHALPSAGGFSQSAVNLRSGARSQLSEVITAALAVLVALFLSPVLSDLPEATLGSMVVVATLGLVSVADMLRLRRIDRAEFWLAAVTALLGLTAGLLVAVAGGVALTLLWVLHELNQPHVAEIRRGSDGSWSPVLGEDADEASADTADVLVLRITGPLYTANVRATTQAIEERCRAAAPSVVVVDARAVARLSVTVLDALTDLDRELRALGTSLWLAELPQEALATARRTRWWRGWEAANRIHHSLEAAVDAATASPGHAQG